MHQKTLHAISKTDKLIEAYHEKLKNFPDNEKLKEGSSKTFLTMKN
jgi:hypothetical protein